MPSDRQSVPEYRFKALKRAPFACFPVLAAIFAMDPAFLHGGRAAALVTAIVPNARWISLGPGCSWAIRLCDPLFVATFVGLAVGVYAALLAALFVALAFERRSIPAFRLSCAEWLFLIMPVTLLIIVFFGFQGDSPGLNRGAAIFSQAPAAGVAVPLFLGSSYFFVAAWLIAKFRLADDWWTRLDPRDPRFRGRG